MSFLLLYLLEADPQSYGEPSSVNGYVIAAANEDEARRLAETESDGDERWGTWPCRCIGISTNTEPAVIVRY
jgi:hypothetical protein